MKLRAYDPTIKTEPTVVVELRTAGEEVIIQARREDGTGTVVELGRLTLRGTLMLYPLTLAAAALGFQQAASSHGLTGACIKVELT